MRLIIQKLTKYDIEYWDNKLREQDLKIEAVNNSTSRGVWAFRGGWIDTLRLEKISLMELKKEAEWNLKWQQSRPWAYIYKLIRIK